MGEPEPRDQDEAQEERGKPVGLVGEHAGQIPAGLRPPEHVDQRKDQQRDGDGNDRVEKGDEPVEPAFSTHPGRLGTGARPAAGSRACPGHSLCKPVPGAAFSGNRYALRAAAVRSLVAVIDALVARIDVLRGEVEAGFGQHPDAEIYLSQPGLGRSWAPGCWPSSATTPTATPTRRRARTTPEWPRSPGPPAPEERCWPVTPATAPSPTP